MRPRMARHRRTASSASAGLPRASPSSSRTESQPSTSRPAPASATTAAHLSSARRWARSAGASPVTWDSSTPETTTDGSTPAARSVARRAGEAEASTSGVFAEVTARVSQAARMPSGPDRYSSPVSGPSSAAPHGGSPSIHQPDHWWYRARSEMLRTVLEPYVGSPERLLDVGSADGPSVGWLSAGQLVSLDLDPRGLQPPSGICGSVLALPFADASFEVVSAFDVLEHCEPESAGPGRAAACAPAGRPPAALGAGIPVGVVRPRRRQRPSPPLHAGQGDEGRGVRRVRRAPGDLRVQRGLPGVRRPIGWCARCGNASGPPPRRVPPTSSTSPR